MTNLPRVLIVGTTPYDPNEASRALDTYFHAWPKDKLRMIFSNVNTPMKWNYESLYQITDYDVLNVFKGKEKEPGRIFNDADLQEASIKDNKTKLNKYKKVSTFRYYARYTLWKKNRWLSNKLINWVDEYKPEAIYICFSDDYFILDIAYFFASKYNIPVIAQIGDDYYFKKHSVFLSPYLRNYKKLFDKIMSSEGFGVYISDKLADKYNSYFKLQGYPFYLSSEIEKVDNPIKYEFNYFGKLFFGRDKSLALLGDMLNKCGDYKVNVYTHDWSKKLEKYFTKHHCELHQPLPYKEVVKIENSGSFNIIASGFAKKDVESTKYSLSTKVSDSLASSGPIIVIGPKGDGAVDFLADKNCAIVVDKEDYDVELLKQQLNDKKLLKSNIENAHKISKELFDKEKNRLFFRQCCEKLLKGISDE